MDETIILLICSGAALIIGIVAGKLIFAKSTKKKIEKAEAQALQIMEATELKSETIKKEKILEAKEKFVQLKAEHDKKVFEINKKVGDTESRTRQKEISINQKEASLERQVKENEVIKENLTRQIEVVTQKRNELEKHQEEHIRRLEKIAA
ncbi:MAG: Rnase Y domain-containing protein, partial [Parafilimonas sp.]